MIISIHRILLPTDFSETANAARQYAVSLADRFGAELHLMHVVPPIVQYADVGSPWVMPENEVEYQIDAADQRLRREVDTVWSEKHPVKYVTIAGFAVDEILKYANDEKIDLMVVGTHGQTGLSRLLIGSVAEKLVRTANCPVLTVHPHGHQFLVDTKND